jgi:hypothetical protein
VRSVGSPDASSGGGPCDDGVMGTRGRRGVAIAGLLVLLTTGCGSASDPSPPTGVDGLEIPTPSVDPDDFVTGIDNPWLPLRVGATWEYESTGDRPGTRTVTTHEGPDIEGVATTAVLAVTTTSRGRTTEVTDFYAEDEAGNVWWFGRLGEWQAGEGGARAGLVMAATPRRGDGYREASAPGVVDRRAEVIGVDGSREVPDGRYDDLVVIATLSQLTGMVEEASYAEGVGLVSLETVAGEPETRLGLVAYDEP